MAKKKRNWVRTAINRAGGVVAVADHFEIKSPSVSQWITTGQIPIVRIPGVMELIHKNGNEEVDYCKLNPQARTVFGECGHGKNAH